MMTAKDLSVRALGLCSGGLDSILSALVLRRQGIDVTWISFETPFFNAAKARRAAEIQGIPLIVQNITPRYLDMLRNPPAGYGKHMNPCMDCHAMMFREAGKIMVRDGYDFLFSGEVRGQRPMSQTLNSLRYVEKQSGQVGRILRPLSARVLPQTLPEQEGLVDRDRLESFSGRSRKPQMALAAQLGVDEYPAPAGGCLLTDKGYADRLRDLLAHCADSTEREMHLLKYGRHLRLNDQCKVAIGRTQRENAAIRGYYEAGQDCLLKAADYPGPTALITRPVDEGMILLAASIVAGYSKAPNDGPAAVHVDRPTGRTVVAVLPLPPKEIGHLIL